MVRVPPISAGHLWDFGKIKNGAGRGTRTPKAEPTASKAAVYTNFTIPALRRYILMNFPAPRKKKTDSRRIRALFTQTSESSCIT